MNLTDLVYIDETGYHFADYPAFLQWRKDQYRAIYGSDVYLENDSQDGQLLAVQAKADYDTAALGAATYNSFSPATAQGVGLSRNVKINGITRQDPSYSSVVLTIQGTAGTVITNGVASDALDQKWNLPATVTIPGGGSIDVTATAQTIGAVTADAGTIETIFTPTRGWQTVTNDSAATPGAPVETDGQLRVRQSVSTANPSLTVFDGTVGAVLNVAGVTKARGYENDTGITDSDGIPAHSVCVVAAGGTDAAVAQAIQIHKTPGTGTFGNTTVLVYDTHGMPLNIKFQRPTVATIKVEVTLAAKAGWSSDFAALIQTAVAAAVNAGQVSADPTPGAAGMGDVILYTKFFPIAYLVGTPAGLTFDISGIQIAKNAGSLAPANITLDFDEDPVCDAASDVTVVVT